MPDLPPSAPLKLTANVSSGSASASPRTGTVTVWKPMSIVPVALPISVSEAVGIVSTATL